MEVWKPIRQNNNYKVSNYGRVRTYNYKYNGKLLTLTQKNKDKKERQVFAILCRNYDKVAIPVNRLVYEHFVGKIPRGYLIFNKDGDPWNNHVDNLVCVSRKDDMFIKLNNNREIKNKQSVRYDYYVDGVFVGGIQDFMKEVGERTHQNVEQRFSNWENRKKTTKWYRDDGVVFSGKLCTRVKIVQDGAKYKRMKRVLSRTLGV